MIIHRALILIFCSATLHSVAQTITVNKENRTIAVTATDEAQVTADVASVTVGFTTYGADQDKTYTDATKISNAIIDALHAKGIKQDAIESTQQSLTAIDSDDKTHYAQGMRFRFSQSWSVTVPATSAANTLQTAITAGANESGGIVWKLTSDEALEGAAEDKALAHAQKIAERYARGLKTRLGALIYTSNQIPQRGFFGGLIQTESVMGSGLGSGAGKINLKPLAIVPGKISKSATVYAVFALE
ncbi:MAG TPA: SIMPL domain-containing protein [Edaphobacter sp.]|nr:SIMPL domain-containing protein [Edaphobacter sp.]